MTEWSAITREATLAPTGQVVIDRLVSRFRVWVEDRLPWYNRAEEREKHERTQEVRKRSIEARIRAESILSAERMRR